MFFRIDTLLLFHCSILFFFFNDTPTTEIYTLSLHDALPIWAAQPWAAKQSRPEAGQRQPGHSYSGRRSHTANYACRSPNPANRATVAAARHAAPVDSQNGATALPEKGARSAPQQSRCSTPDSWQGSAANDEPQGALALPVQSRRAVSDHSWRQRSEERRVG